MENRSRVVLDASVAIKWFVDEEGSDRALLLLERMLEQVEQFIVPELFFFELGNILNRLITDDVDERLELLNSILDCGLPRVPMTRELQRLTRAYQKRGLSGYDGAYAALAEYIGGVWVTADKVAHKKVASLSVSALL